MLLQDGEFKFYSVPVPYKIIQINNGYIKNKVSGENCGNRIVLYKRFYTDDGQLLDQPQVDEDVYEVIYDGADN